MSTIVNVNYVATTAIAQLFNSMTLLSLLKQGYSIVIVICRMASITSKPFPCSQSIEPLTLKISWNVYLLSSRISTKTFHQLLRYIFNEYRWDQLIFYDRFFGLDFHSSSFSNFYFSQFAYTIKVAVTFLYEPCMQPHLVWMVMGDDRWERVSNRMTTVKKTNATQLSNTLHVFMVQNLQFSKKKILLLFGWIGSANSHTTTLQLTLAEIW